MSEPLDTLTPPPVHPVDPGYQLQWGDDLATDFSFSNLADLPAQEIPSLLEPQATETSPYAPPLQDWAPGLPSPDQNALLASQSERERPSGGTIKWTATEPLKLTAADLSQPIGTDQAAAAQAQADAERRDTIRESFVPMFTNAEALESNIARFSKDYVISKSKDPRGLMMRAANRNYLRFDTGKPITSDTEYQAEMDKWAMAHGGWPGMNDREGFALIAHDLRRGVNTKTALDAVLPAITLGLAKAHASGTTTQWFEPFVQWMHDNPGLAKNFDEGRAIDIVRQYHQQQSALMDQYGNKVLAMAGLLGHTQGQAEPDEVAVGAAASQLSGIPAADRAWILQTAATLKQSEPNPEGYWNTLGHAVQRGAGGMATSMTRNTEQLDLHNRLAYLQYRKEHGIEARETQPINFDPMLSAGLDGGLSASPMSSVPQSPYPDLDAIPLKNIDAHLADLKEQSEQLDREREVRAVANGQIDALRPTATGWLGRTQQATYGVAESVPLMATAAVPGIGTYVAGAAMLSQNYDHVRVKYPDLAPQSALGLAATETAAQTVLLNMAVSRIVKSFPATTATLTGFERLTPREHLGEIAKNTLIVGGSNEFSIATPALVEGLAKSLGADLPDYDAEKEFQGFLEAQPETLLMMALPWVAASGGVGVRKLFPKLVEAQHAQILTKLGYPPDRAAAIAAEKDPLKQRAMQAEEWAKIPDEQKQQLIRNADAQNIAARKTGQFTEAPSILKLTGKDVEGRPQDVYHVLHEDGSLAYSTTNLQAADKVRQGLVEEAASENFLRKSRLNKLQQSDKLNSDERAKSESNGEGPETLAVQSGKGLSEKFEQRTRLAIEGASRKLTKLGIAVSETNEGSHVFYATDGTIDVRLDHKDILRGTEEAKRLGLPLDEYVKLVAGEETAHAAQLFLVREDWIANGRPGDFDVYADRHFAALYNEMKSAISGGSLTEQTALKNALADSWNLYVGEFSKGNPPATGENILEKVASEKNGDVTLMAEFSRQIIQLKRDGKITESFYARIQTVFHDWIAKALAAIKRSPQWADDGRFGEGLRNEINRTEKLLNHLESDMPDAHERPPRSPESSSINKQLRDESGEGKNLLTRPIASEVSGDYGAHKLAAPRGVAYMSKDERARDPAIILQDLLRGSGGAAQSQRRKHGRELASHSSLMAWEDEHGRLLRPEIFASADAGGGEHAVVHDRETDRLLKLTKPGLFGAQAEDAGKYLERWALSNRVFGDDVKIEGTVQLPGEQDRRLAISQPYIKGRDATAAEQEDFLRGKGFVEVDGKWVHPIMGVSVWDTQTPGNVIVSPDGSYHAVDLQIGPAGAEELKAAREKSGIGGELKFSK